MDNIPLLYCVQLIKCYQRGDCVFKVLNNITLVIESNEIIAIVGASGSGKSTLLHLLGGLDKPTEGEIFFRGHALHKLSDKARSVIRNKYLGFIYQFHHLLLDFNVLENVAMPLLIGGMKWSTAQNRARSVLETIGLKDRFFYFPHELSGGESQRVTIARAIINNPILVLADEPTGNLDVKNSESVLQLLKTINMRYGTTFIIATHDLNLASQCHKILTISDGNIKSIQNNNF